MKMLSCFLSVLLLIHGSFSFAGGVDGAERGGGDPITAEFTQYGTAIAQDLESWNHELVGPATRKNFSAAIQNFPVVLVDGAVLDSQGNIVTAVTDLKKKQIEVSRGRWNAIGYMLQYEKIAIVFHEYMRAAGYGHLENTYSLTTQFLKHVKMNSATMHSTTLHTNNVQKFKLAIFIGASGKKIVCAPLGGADSRSFVISATGSQPGQVTLELRYPGGEHYLTKSKTEPFGKISQIAVGESILISMKDGPAKDVLRFDSPFTPIGCGYGTESHAARAEDAPEVRVISCCLHQ